MQWKTVDPRGVAANQLAFLILIGVGPPGNGLIGVGPSQYIDLAAIGVKISRINGLRRPISHIEVRL